MALFRVSVARLPETQVSHRNFVIRPGCGGSCVRKIDRGLLGGVELGRYPADRDVREFRAPPYLWPRCGTETEKSDCKFRRGERKRSILGRCFLNDRVIAGHCFPVVPLHFGRPLRNLNL